MKRLLCFVAVASLSACVGPAPAGSASQAIVNGTTDADDPAVVMVLAHMPNSTMASLCTGEIVSPHVVLTAAHCLDPALLGGTGSIFDVFTGTMPSATTPKLAVQDTHFNAKFDSNAPENGNDVGVLILAAPTNITPVAYNREAMPQSMVGSAARLVGYGITAAGDTASAGTKRQAPTTLARLDNLFVGLQDGLHGICEGDSGGPAFMKFNGTERIAGVTSFGFMNCPLTPPAGTPSTFEAGNDTRIDTYADFIDQWVLMLDPPAKGPGDACNSDTDCTPRACDQTSVGKICVQSCDPAAMPSTCPANTMCTNVDGANLCASMGGGKGGGGCSVAHGHMPAGDAALLLALVGLVALRRRARA